MTSEGDPGRLDGRPPWILRVPDQVRMWGPAAVWAGVLVLLSAWPNPVGPPWLVVSDKLVHFVLYAVLGALLSLGRSWSGANQSHAVMLAVGMLYGVVAEWHQSWVPSRTPSWADWLADGAGVAAGYALVLFLVRYTGSEAGPQQRTG